LEKDILKINFIWDTQILGKNILNSPHKNVIGSIITEKGFLSTSMVEKIANRHNKGVMLKISVPKLSKAGYLGTISEYLEAEILFNKNQKLQITDIYEKNGTKIIECDLII